MKNNIYKILFILITFLSAFKVQGEIVIGISDPFQFGTPIQPPSGVPLGPLAYIISAGLVGLYTFWRNYKLGRKENF